MNRIILHIDMDAFFASVEQACHPALKGRAVAVIGAGKRTVVTTCSYEARKYGVKTGMTVPEARRNCPHLLFVEGDHKKYAYTSARINRIFLRYTPLVEMYSVDESFLDLSHCIARGRSVVETAHSIKKDIYNECGLTCSVGIAPNKLLAKLISDRSKPNGLFYLQAEHVSSFIEHLPVEELCGIGKKTKHYLNSLGIETCGELGRTSLRKLKKHFGLNGEKLFLMGKGIDESPVLPIGNEEDAKSIGHSSTFDRDIMTRCLLDQYLLKLSDMVSHRMRQENYWGQVLTVTVRYNDFTTFSRQRALKEYIQHTHSIFYYAKDILEEKFSLSQPVRLLGVSISRLKKDEYQEGLFDDIHKKIRLFQAIDKVNDRFGDNSLTWGRLLGRSLSLSHVISPSWRPARG